MTKIGNSGYRHFFIIEILIYLDLDIVMATINDMGLSIYYVIRDGGGLPDLLQYYIGVGLESLLQVYSFERKMEGYNPFSALN